MRRIAWVVLVVGWLGALPLRAFAEAPAPPADKAGRFPHVEFNVEKKQVRVECEALNVNAPLEFFCCMTGTNEHESVLRTAAKPSHIQIGLLALGLQPGAPVTYSEATKKWLPPHGPPLRISVEYAGKDGKIVSAPAQHWLRDVKTKKEPGNFAWVYAGSRVMTDGRFAADLTGYVVSLVNFDLTLIDVPDLASSANETLEWERNPDAMPATGTKVWMVIEPVGDSRAKAPAPGGPVAPAPPAAPTTQPTPAAGGAPLSDVKIDEQRVKALREYWEKRVGPRAASLRDAAQAHYEVISALRREQQRLIEEADRVQRTIDQLDKDYQDLTTPHPAGGESRTEENLKG